MSNCNNTQQSQLTTTNRQHYVKTNGPFVDGSCLLFVRYRSELDRRMRNAVVRFLWRLQQYDGTVLGISDNTTVVEAPEDSAWLDHNDWRFLVLVFSNQSKARLWYISEPELKQHDFPPPSNGIDVFSVPIRYIPDHGKLTFCWVEFDHIQSKGIFNTDYVDKVRQLYDDNGVNHGIAFIKDSEDDKIDRLRDSWMQPKSHYCLNLFDSEDQYWNLFDSEVYKPLRSRQQELCDTTSVLFTINPKIA